MKKIIIILSVSFFAFAFASSVLAATPNWDISGDWALDFAGGSANREFRDLVQDEDGVINGNFWWLNGVTWEYGGTLVGSVSGNDLYLDYDRVSINYTGQFWGTITNLGISGTFKASSGFECDWHTVSGTATFKRHAEIVKPEEDEVIFKNLDLEAYLFDNDEDSISWAVRKGTCAAGTNTVLGNVDGYTDSLTMAYDGTYTYTYTGSFDVTGLEGGMYCFIFNPSEDSEESTIRLTREFYVARGHVNGGGQIREDADNDGKDKNKDDYKISFGGQVWDVGSEEYMGDWQINFHNIGDDEYDKARFHATEIQTINFFTGDTPSCDEAMNMTLTGTLNGEEGYKVIFRAGDLMEGRCAGEYPDGIDTVRIELYKNNNKVYDTHEGDFANESSCVGSARTGLDAGNIKIEFTL
ncbi:MAG: hypothetical protein ACTSQA_08045 [Candidatus Heimdallarchaeaceae archaeon]